jgi:hypothetical protein
MRREAAAKIGRDSAMPIMFSTPRFAFLRFAALAFCAVVMHGGVALADGYPDHPVKIIVPFPAGGSADAVPRLVADWLSRKWGQTVIIENHTAAAARHESESLSETRL